MIRLDNHSITESLPLITLAKTLSFTGSRDLDMDTQYYHSVKQSRLELLLLPSTLTVLSWAAQLVWACLLFPATWGGVYSAQCTAVNLQSRAEAGVAENLEDICSPSQSYSLKQMATALDPLAKNSTSFLNEEKPTFCFFSKLFFDFDILALVMKFKGTSTVLFHLY